MIRTLLYQAVDIINIQKLRIIKGLHLEGDFIVKGSPIVDVVKGAKITIGHNCTLNSRNYGYHVAVYSPVKLFADYKGAVISIGENTRIHGSCIHAYKSITLGKGSVVAAGSVVTKNVPPYCIVGGNPAKILRRYEKKCTWDEI